MPYRRDCPIDGPLEAPSADQTDFRFVADSSMSGHLDVIRDLHSFSESPHPGSLDGASGMSVRPAGWAETAFPEHPPRQAWVLSNALHRGRAMRPYSSHSPAPGRRTRRMVSTRRSSMITGAAGATWRVRTTPAGRNPGAMTVGLKVRR